MFLSSSYKTVEPNEAFCLSFFTPLRIQQVSEGRKKHIMNFKFKEKNKCNLSGARKMKVKGLLGSTDLKRELKIKLVNR